MDDCQVTQLSKTYDLALRHLAEMEAQRAELDEAIGELKTQIAWGEQELARRKRNETAA
jgi:hypothetical protein